MRALCEDGQEERQTNHAVVAKLANSSCYFGGLDLSGLEAIFELAKQKREGAGDSRPTTKTEQQRRER